MATEDDEVITQTNQKARLARRRWLVGVVGKMSQNWASIVVNRRPLEIVFLARLPMNVRVRVMKNRTRATE
jgi:hypothetical protein